MKHETVRGLMTARVLFDKAQELCVVDDKSIASAGLVILQDAVELILYACLIELGVDEEKPLEDLGFDGLIRELKRKKIRIAKSSTLRALNKDRVTVKHFGQLAEPESVRSYLDASRLAADTLLTDVVGTSLNRVMLHEVIKNEEVKQHIQEASEAIEKVEYFTALASIRKALFIEIEEDYSIEGWKDYPRSEALNPLEGLRRGGWKAPYYNRNAEWIEKNVKDPFDYIQFDHDRLRVDLIEWGVNTQDFWNLWRLTPPVFRFRGSKKWVVRGEQKYSHKMACV